MSVQWNNADKALRIDPTIKTPSSRTVKSLSLVVDAASNVVSLPAQAIGVIGGVVAGSGAAVAALLRGNRAGDAFCKYGSKGASATTRCMSMMLFPLTAISYGLSRIMGNQGVFARSNSIVNILLREEAVKTQKTKIEIMLEACEDSSLKKVANKILESFSSEKNPNLLMLCKKLREDLFNDDSLSDDARINFSFHNANKLLDEIIEDFTLHSGPSQFSERMMIEQIRDGYSQSGKSLTPEQLKIKVLERIEKEKANHIKRIKTTVIGHIQKVLEGNVTPSKKRDVEED